MRLTVCGKGGSGKSVTSTLLAKSLAKRGYKFRASLEGKELSLDLREIEELSGWLVKKI